MAFLIQKWELEDKDIINHRNGQGLPPFLWPTSQKRVWSETSGRPMKETETPENAMWKLWKDVSQR